MKLFKLNTPRAISRVLREGELRQFHEQRGLNGNTCWLALLQKYRDQERADVLAKAALHPPHSGQKCACGKAQEYRWSSAGHIERFGLDLEAGLPYTVFMEEFTTRGPDGKPQDLSRGDSGTIRGSHPGHERL
jgi:hypothetical protein